MSKNIGWECPKCGKCYAPHIDQCMACAVEPYGSYGINPNGGFYPVMPIRIGSAGGDEEFGSYSGSVSYRPDRPAGR